MGKIANIRIDAIESSDQFTLRVTQIRPPAARPI